MDGPAPGSYNVEGSFIKTQWGAVPGPTKRTSKNVCFVDKHKDLFKQNPGPDYYKKIDDGLKNRSRLLFENKKVRH